MVPLLWIVWLNGGPLLTDFEWQGIPPRVAVVRSRGRGARRGRTSRPQTSTTAAMKQDGATLPPPEAMPDERGQEDDPGDPGEPGPTALPVAASRGPARSSRRPGTGSRRRRRRSAAAPCQLTSRASSGVPSGKPSAGSARKTPAATRLTPYTAISRGAQVECRQRPRRPTANAIVISPVTMRLAIWIQPESAVGQQAPRVPGRVETRPG